MHFVIIKKESWCFVKKFEYKIRDMSRYCEDKGIDPVELTLKELEMFRFEVEAKYEYFPVGWGGYCVVCQKRTGLLCHGYEIYICTQKCFEYFELTTNDSDSFLFQLKSEKKLVWQKEHIKDLLMRGYELYGISKRCELPVDEIKQIINEINSEKI
jgi:hypothetical protein